MPCSPKERTLYLHNYVSAQTWPADLCSSRRAVLPSERCGWGIFAFSPPAAATEAGWDITADHQEHLKKIQNRNKQEQSKSLRGMTEAKWTRGSGAGWGGRKVIETDCQLGHLVTVKEVSWEAVVWKGCEVGFFYSWAFSMASRSAAAQLKRYYCTGQCGLRYILWY